MVKKPAKESTHLAELHKMAFHKWTCVYYTNLPSSMIVLHSNTLLPIGA